MFKYVSSTLYCCTVKTFKGRTCSTYQHAAVVRMLTIKIRQLLKNNVRYNATFICILLLLEKASMQYSMIIQQCSELVTHSSSLWVLVEFHSKRTRNWHPAAPDWGRQCFSEWRIVHGVSVCCAAGSFFAYISNSSSHWLTFILQVPTPGYKFKRKRL